MTSSFISYKKPAENNYNKKIRFCYSIENYDEISNFYEQYNTMSTGNLTLLPKSQLETYLSYDNVVVLMRNEVNNKLIGMVLSILLPIKNCENENEEIITHGCTTFLILHPCIRNLGICKILTQELIIKGYEKSFYCDYHTTSFNLGNGIPIECWYRPIDLERSIELGFLYSDCFDIRKKTKNKIIYTTKLPKDYSYIKVTETDKSLEFYRNTTKNKKFVFWPDEELWNKWINNFPTYLIYCKNDPIGIVSINTINCIMTTKKKGKIAHPIICNGNINEILKVLPNIVKDYDVLYFHAYGDTNVSILNTNNYIKTDHKVCFSLHNNKIMLKSSDISVPFL